jgi:hypothetical protein
VKKTLTLLALATVTAGLGAAQAEETKPHERRIVVMQHGAGEARALPEIADLQGDKVKIEDLDSLLPGEARSYWTEGNREVVVTRGEGERYTLEVEGKKVEIGAEHDELLAAAVAGGEGRRVVVRREHHDGPKAEGAATAEVEADVLVGAPIAIAADGDNVIVEIASGTEEKQERRIVVVRLDEPAAQ